jgi:PAS domain S-box-containing protein
MAELEQYSDGDKYKGLLRAVVETAVDGIITIDPQGLIITANPAIERMFGHKPEALVGKNVSLLMPEPYHGQHDQYLANYRESGTRRIIGIGREVLGLRVDGSTFPVDLAVSETPTESGPIFTGVLRDISERHQAEAAVRRERALLKAVVDTAVDGILTIDSMGKVLSANPAVERIFGYTPEELIGENVRKLMPSPYHEEHDQYLDNYRRSGDKKIIGIGRDVSGRRKDGTTFPLYLAVSETFTEEGVIFTGIVRDITDREQAAEFRLAKEAADQANAAKSEFLSRMSHELRTPLNAVIGFAQLLDMRFDDPPIQEASQSILKAGKHLLNLINEVLDLAGIEAGRVSLSLEPVSLKQQLSAAISLLEPLAEAASVEIRSEIDPSDEDYVMADGQRLLQVFINLLSNAIKYNSKQGCVTIRKERPDIETARIIFTDTGPGIPEDSRRLLFQPFERLGNYTAEGTGLGLVLSRRFVKLMGGDLDLADSSPKGSTFEVLLKTTDKPDIESGKTRRIAPRQSSRVGKGRVLYIEDNLSNLKLLEMTLAECSEVELIPAMQGRVGMELARTLNPDVILLDLHLPDMSGVEILNQLRGYPETALIPIVIISADATQNQIVRLRRAGAYDYLTKPIDISHFITIIEQLIPLEGDN